MRRILLIILLSVCPAWTALAQTALTTITGTVTAPNGSHPSGTAVITNQRALNDANPRQTIFPSRVPITVTNGVINVSLFPNEAMLPPATCYTVQYTLSGFNQTRYWYVPKSAASLDVGVVEGNIPCAQQSGASVAPGQIAPAGASVGQVLTWNGNFWTPQNGGGGGGGNPGGNNGQLQFNSLGTFGGFTVGGDCIVSLPNFICTKTNGNTFAASATTDTTNAGNISTGLLAPARGGTGAAGPFSQGGVLFVGTSGIFGQDNSNFFWDLTNHRLGVGTNSPQTPVDIRGGAVSLNIQGPAAANTNLKMTDGGGTNIWILAATTTGQYTLFNQTGGFNPWTASPANNFLVGGQVDAGYRLGVYSNGSTGTAQFVNLSSGATVVGIRASASQGTTPLLQFESAAPAALSQIGPDGCLNELNGAFNRSVVICPNLIGLTSPALIQWRNGAAWDASAIDLSMSRLGAGILGVGNGVLGDFSGSLKLANMTLTGAGFLGGGTVAVCVDNSGNVTTSGCPGGGGGGTVTHTSGPLTASRLVVGNGSNDVTVLGSPGTTTTLLHGNAGGNPSYSAVVLTTDVGGILPFANGGMGLNTNFSNHFFFGNNSGGTAAPVAVQPTWADLAAGTALSVATFPGGDLFIGGVNAQSGTSYTIAASDENKLVTFNNGSAVAVTLPQANTAGFTSGAHFHVFNRGAGAVTITPTTSTINGSATAVLNQNQGAFIVSDGANYSAWISAAPTGGGTVTNVATSGPITGGPIVATGTIGCATCVTSAAALVSNQLVLGGGLQASATLGSLGTTTTLLHGNAGGAPSFGAVSLTADVTGVLPTANIAVALANQTSINGLSITASTGTLAIANGKTITQSNTLTYTGTDGSTVAFGTGGTATYTANNLSVFAATTSAQLASVLTNETGTVLAVFNTDPTLVGPLFTNEAEGTCDVGNRGKFTTVTGGAGVADTVRICVKRADDTYAFTPVI